MHNGAFERTNPSSSEAIDLGHNLLKITFRILSGDFCLSSVTQTSKIGEAH